MPAKPIPTKLGVIGVLPSYYQDRIWRGLARAPEIELTVVYLSDVGIRDGFYDQVFATTRSWRDRIDLDAYASVFLRNVGSHKLPGPLFRVNPGLLPLLARSPFDVVLVPGHGTVSTLGVILACIATGTPMIYRGEATPTRAPKRLFTRGRQILDRAILRSMDVVMYSCTGNRNFFEERGVRPEQLMLIPCAVENDYYQQQLEQWHPRRDETRAEIGAAPRDVVVVSLAQLIARKGMEHIPRIAAEVDAAGLDRRVRWVIVGEGPLRAEIEATIARLGLSNVRLVGYQDQHQLGRWLAAADLGMLLSDHDNSPKALNEMMNFGLAIVCTEPIGNAFDLVREGMNGYIVPAGDVAGAARAVISLVEGGNWRSFGEASREIVGRWSFDADVAAIREAVRRISRRRRTAQG